MGMIFMAHSLREPVTLLREIVTTHNVVNGIREALRHPLAPAIVTALLTWLLRERKPPKKKLRSGRRR
jgi:hypothetical protein